jgi:hypothetical protein
VGVYKRAEEILALPIIMWLVLLGGLIVLTSGSVVAPFIYTLFRVGAGISLDENALLTALFGNPSSPNWRVFSDFRLAS